MLIIRIGLANDRSLGTSGATSNGAIVPSAWGAGVAVGGATDHRSAANPAVAMRRRADGTFEMRDLKVEITQVVEHDGEYGSDLAASEPDADVKRAGPLDVDGDLDVEAGAYRQQGKTADRSFAV